MRSGIWYILGLLSGGIGTYGALKFFAGDVSSNAFAKTSSGRKTNRYRAILDKYGIPNKVHKSGFLFHKEKKDEKENEEMDRTVSEEIPESVYVVTDETDCVLINHNEYSLHISNGVPAQTMLYDVETNVFMWENTLIAVDDPKHWIGEVMNNIVAAGDSTQCSNRFYIWNKTINTIVILKRVAFNSELNERPIDS